MRRRVRYDDRAAVACDLPSHSNGEANRAPLLRSDQLALEGSRSDSGFVERPFLVDGEPDPRADVLGEIGGVPSNP
jgi:hypothetical protein